MHHFIIKSVIAAVVAISIASAAMLSRWDLNDLESKVPEQIESSQSVVVYSYVRYCGYQRAEIAANVFLNNMFVQNGIGRPPVWLTIEVKSGFPFMSHYATIECHRPPSAETVIHGALVIEPDRTSVRTLSLYGWGLLGNFGVLWTVLLLVLHGIHRGLSRMLNLPTHGGASPSTYS